MPESTMTANGNTTVPVQIRQAIGGVPGTRLIWQILSSGRLSVRVKNKTATDVKSIVKVRKGRRLEIDEMRP